MKGRISKKKTRGGWRWGAWGWRKRERRVMLVPGLLMAEELLGQRQGGIELRTRGCLVHSLFSGTKTCPALEPWGAEPLADGVQRCLPIVGVSGRRLLCWEGIQRNISNMQKARSWSELLVPNGRAGQELQWLISKGAARICTGI